MAVCCMDDITSTITHKWGEAVLHHGSSPALDDYVTGKVYTYLQLDGIVQTAASRLCAQLLDGATRINGENQEIGLVLCVAEGPAMVALVLSCALSSLFYVPVDLAKTPPRRVSFTATDCGARALVAWRKDLPGYMPTGIALLAAEDLLAGSFGLSSLPPPSAISPPPCCRDSQADVRPSQALYAIYTSGSTGKPKGVMVEHSNMVAFAKAKARDERIGPGARVLLASTFTFDLCEGDLYASLMHGAALVVAPRDALLHDLATVLQHSEATHVTLTPSLFGLLNGNRVPTSRHSSSSSSSSSSYGSSTKEAKGYIEGPQDLPHLRSLCLGGESMPRTIVTAWAEVSAQEQDARMAAMASSEVATVSDVGMQLSKAEVPNEAVSVADSTSQIQPALAMNSSPLELRSQARAGCVLRNIYGATEGTVHQCSQVMHQDTPANRVGKPLTPNTVVLVASWPDDNDENSSSDRDSSSSASTSSLEPTLVVPPWEIACPKDGRVNLDASAIGEVTVVGATVARGYLHRPDLSASKFRSTPRLGRVYRTGDLARWVRITPPPPSAIKGSSDGNADGSSSGNSNGDPNHGWCLELLGRSGQEVGLVKVNGQRVEVGEVEAVLKQLPLVRDAAVLLLPPPQQAHRAPLHEGSSTGFTTQHVAVPTPVVSSADGGGAATAHSLAAVVVLQDGDDDDEDDNGTPLDEHTVAALTLGCAAALPRHMVPARFGTMAWRVQSNASPSLAQSRDRQAGLRGRKRPLPLTGSGKLDYRRLSHLFTRAVAAQTSHGDGTRATAAKGQTSIKEDSDRALGKVSKLEAALVDSSDRSDQREAVVKEDGDIEAIDLFVRPGELEPPKTYMEHAVASAWAVALGLAPDQVGRHDSFVALGGDSLAALRASRLLTATTTSNTAATTSASTTSFVTTNHATAATPFATTSGTPASAEEEPGTSSTVAAKANRYTPEDFRRDAGEKQLRQLEREKEQGMAQGEAALILHRLELQTSQARDGQNNHHNKYGDPTATLAQDGEKERKANSNIDVGNRSVGDEDSSNGGEAACLFGVTMGPLAPCELDVRPVLKDYAQFLTSRGVRAIVNGGSEEESTEVEANGTTGNALDFNESGKADCGEGCEEEEEDIKDESNEDDDTAPSSSSSSSLPKNAVASNQVLRALVAAASHGRLPLLRTLLAAGADPSGRGAPVQTSGYNFFTPLHAAAASTHPRAPEALQILLEALTPPSTDGSALASTKSAFTLNHRQASEIGIVQGSVLHAVVATTAAGSTAAHFCAARGDAASLEALLRAGCPVLARDADGQTCLTLAARAGALSAVKTVLAHAASETPSAVAVAAEGSPPTVMVSKNEESISKSYDSADNAGVGNSKSVPAGQEGVVLSSLLESRDRWGRTPLAWAILGGHMCTVDALLEAGADPESSPLLRAGGFSKEAEVLKNDNGDDDDDDGNGFQDGNDDEGDPFLKKDATAASYTRADDGSTLYASGSSNITDGPREDKRLSGRGSGAPAHQARKRASNTDALAGLLQALTTNNSTGRQKIPSSLHASTLGSENSSASNSRNRNGDLITPVQALAAAAEAAAAVRTLVCTSNANRMRCRELGGVAALVTCLQPLILDDYSNNDLEETEKKSTTPIACTESSNDGAAATSTTFTSTQGSITTAAPSEAMEAAMTSLHVACAGALRNLAYGNEDNRVAIAEGGGVTALARFVQPPLQSSSSSSRNQDHEGPTGMGSSRTTAMAAMSGEKRHLAFVCAGALCNIAMSHTSHASILAEKGCIAAIETLFATDQSNKASGGVGQAASNGSEEAVPPHPGLKRLRAAAAAAVAVGTTGTAGTEVIEGAGVVDNLPPKSRYGAFRDRKRARGRETIGSLVAAIWAASAVPQTTCVEATNSSSLSAQVPVPAPALAPTETEVSAAAAAAADAARALGAAVCGDPRARDAAREEGAIPALVHLLGWAVPSAGDTSKDSSSHSDVADEVHGVAAGALELVLFGSDANRADALACGGVPALASLVKQADFPGHAIDRPKSRDASAADLHPQQTSQSQTSAPAPTPTYRVDADELVAEQPTAVRAAKALCNIAMSPASHSAILSEPQLVETLTRVLATAQKRELEAAAAQKAAAAAEAALLPPGRTNGVGVKKARGRKTPPGLHPGLVRLQVAAEAEAGVEAEK